MSDEYDLKPLEPPKPEISPAAEPAKSDAAPTAASDVVAADAAVTPPPIPPFTPPVPIIEGPDPEPPDPTQEDIEKHKGVSIVSYIPPLFIVPLVIAPASRFARYHANQGLLIFIIGLVGIIAAAILELLNWTIFKLVEAFGMGIIAWVGACATHVAAAFIVVLIIALAIVGILHAVNGESKPLPMIGRFQLLKP